MKRFTRNALAAALVVSAVIVGIATPAIAVPQLVAATVADPAPIFVFDGVPMPVVVGIITGAIIPAIVGLIDRLVTKVSGWSVSPYAKGIVLSVLSVVSGAVLSISEALTTGTPINIGILLATAVSAFVVAVTSYFGVTSRRTASGRSIANLIKGDAG